MRTGGPYKAVHKHIDFGGEEYDGEIDASWGPQVIRYALF